jgi:heme-degrading monooxygenase HmoA
MIIRIVQMTFQQDKIGEFTALFDEQVFFTYSKWESEADLNHYRFSAFFKETWTKTKMLFAAQPNAWSVVTKATAG